MFPDITHIKVNNGRRSAILNFIHGILYPGKTTHIVLRTDKQTYSLFGEQNNIEE